MPAYPTSPRSSRATRSFPGDPYPGDLATVHLTTAPTVTAGQQYAIVAQSTGEWGWETGFVAAYAGGNLYQQDNGGAFVERSYDGDFETFVTPAPPTATGPRGAYCTVAGNTTDSGDPIAAGTFVNLDDGQIYSDPHYTGATPAIFVQGEGLTCGAPPAGYTQQGDATSAQDVDSNTYPYYAPSTEPASSLQGTFPYDAQ